MLQNFCATKYPRPIDRKAKMMARPHRRIVNCELAMCENGLDVCAICSPHVCTGEPKLALVCFACLVPPVAVAH